MNTLPEEVQKSILVLHTNAKTYKAIITTCREWRALVMCIYATNRYMNALSTLVARHPELKWNWDTWVKYLTDDTIIKYLYDIPRLLSTYHKSTLKWYELDDQNDHKLILEYFGKLAWFQHILVNYCKLNKQFVVSNFTNDELMLIGENRGLTMEIVEKYCSQFGEQEWYDISLMDNLSLEFIDKYSDKLNWQNLFLKSMHIMKLREMFPNRIDWNCKHTLNKYLTHDYIRENWKELGYNICKHKNFTLDLIHECVKHYGCSTKLFGDYLAINPNLDHAFITRFWHMWDGSSYDDLTCKNIRFNLLTDDQRDKLWDNISFIHVLTLDQLETNIDKLKGIYYD